MLVSASGKPFAEGIQVLPARHLTAEQTEIISVFLKKTSVMITAQDTYQTVQGSFLFLYQGFPW